MCNSLTAHFMINFRCIFNICDWALRWSFVSQASCDCEVFNMTGVATVHVRDTFACFEDLDRMIKRNIS